MADDTSQEALNFWNARAGLGAAAGSQDLIAKELEIRAICDYVRDGMRILEVGCGNGITSLEIARRFDVSILAFDYSEEMIKQARELASGFAPRGKVTFQVGDVRAVSGIAGTYDLVVSERALINLPDFPTQRRAIADICGRLAPGGSYVMCENSQDGLDRINEMRERLGLSAIRAPWHNRYFTDRDVAEIVMPGVQLSELKCYSSTYYFLSRVVNASLAAQEGKEPQYDSPVNRLALSLPAIADLGQGKIWLWKKAG